MKKNIRIENVKKVTLDISRKFDWNKNKVIKVDIDDAVSVPLYAFYKGKLLDTIYDFLEVEFQKLAKNDILIIDKDNKRGTTLIVKNRLGVYRVAFIPKKEKSKLIHIPF